MRVLYYTVVSLMSGADGGSICCRNHVTRLAQDPDIQLFGLAAGPPEWKDATDAFFASLGVSAHFQPMAVNNVYHTENRLGAVARFAAKTTFQFPQELQAMNQPHIQNAMQWFIDTHKIDVVLIDHHPSTLFVKLPIAKVKTAIISLNREGDFYADQIKFGQTHHGSLTAPISLWRARRYEKRINGLADKIITIGRPDLPTGRLPSKPACITPYLDPAPTQWGYTPGGGPFFIGNIAHYPNRLAVTWLTQRLAPLLLARDAGVTLSIVGAAATDVPEADRHPNVAFLGRADAGTVARLFLEQALLICPVENDFGVKFKTVEALSYGTPLLVSEQTMLGLPQLSGLPTLNLDRPQEAAGLICELVASPDRLRALSAMQTQQQSAFIATQAGIWSRTLGDWTPG